MNLQEAALQAVSIIRQMYEDSWDRTNGGIRAQVPADRFVRVLLPDTVTKSIFTELCTRIDCKVTFKTDKGIVKYGDLTEEGTTLRITVECRTSSTIMIHIIPYHLGDLYVRAFEPKPDIVVHDVPTIVTLGNQTNELT